MASASAVPTIWVLESDEDIQRVGLADVESATDVELRKIKATPPFDAQPVRNYAKERKPERITTCACVEG